MFIWAGSGVDTELLPSICWEGPISLHHSSPLRANSRKQRWASWQVMPRRGGMRAQSKDESPRPLFPHITLSGSLCLRSDDSSTAVVQTRSGEGRTGRETWACCLGQMVYWEQMPGTKKTLLSGCHRLFQEKDLRLQRTGQVMVRGGAGGEDVGWEGARGCSSCPSAPGAHSRCLKALQMKLSN